MSSASNPKLRHYAHLASRLRNLTAALQDTEVQMDKLSDHLGAMQKIGINCGSQFMAVSRLLDVELNAENERIAQESEAGSGQGQAGSP